MTPRAQQIALAEMAGYVWYWTYAHWDSNAIAPVWRANLRFRPEDGIECQTWIGTAGETRHMTEEEIDRAKASGEFDSTAPDYLRDLNALAALRAYLFKSERYSVLRYGHELSAATQGRPAWASFDATPEEHAEAILRMAGQWVES